ncbi:MAG TPA: DUF3617 family protein [Nevskiaceae bacterium]|nr:DUF3617 family protein [Nevskiaceae bacterium]
MRTVPRRLACVALLAAGAVAASFAAAQDFPKRKSGLWEIRTQSTGSSKATASAQAASIQMCIDEKTDDAVQQQVTSAAKQTCSKQDVRKSGREIVVDSVCKFGDSTATTHSVFTGSFDSAYKVQTKSSYDPPMMGMKEASALIEAKWLGPCKADQKPGDMILGNGMKINMNEKKGAPARNK